MKALHPDYDVDSHQNTSHPSKVKICS